MKLFKRSILILVPVLILLLSFNSVWAAPKGKVTIAVAIPMGMDIFNFKSGVGSVALKSVYQEMTTVNTEGTDRAPNLATSWKLSDDGKSIRFDLDKRAVFHNGDPVTAKDVRFSWEQYTAGTSSFKRVARTIADVQIIDDHTVVFVLKRPDADWLWELTRVPIGSKNYFEKVGAKKFNKEPIGSGPFRFVSRDPGTSVVLEAVDNHWFKTPEFKTLKFMIVPDAVTRMALLEKGTVDMTYPVDPFLVKRLSKNKKIKIKTVSVPSYFGLAFNSSTFPIMEDKNLRLAINYAVNRQEIVDEIFMGKGYPLYYFASKAEPGFDPSIKYEYNPEKAKELLKNSSYKSGTTLKMAYTEQLPSGNLVSAAVQDYLKNVGITVKVQKVERATYMKLGLKRDPLFGELPFIVWPGGKSPTSRLFMGLLTKGKGAAGLWSLWKGRPAIDKLIMAQSVQIDEAKRIKMLRKIAAMTHDDPSGVALFGMEQIYALSNRIDFEWAPNIAGYPRNLWDIKMLK